MNQPFEFERRWTHAGRWRLFVRVNESADRTGPRIVLVHGLSSSSSYMLPTGRLLAGRHCVYAPDLPGFGRSSKPLRTLHVAELADAMAGWMRLCEFGMQPAVLLGNSLGCQIIVDLAVRYPELVKALVLVGPTIDQRAPSMIGQILHALPDLPHERLSFWPHLAFEFFRSGPIRTALTLHRAILDPVASKLPHVAAPTLVVRGSCDPIVSHAWAQEVTRLLPQGRLIEIESGGHVANYSNPEPLARAVEAFLNDL